MHISTCLRTGKLSKAEGTEECDRSTRELKSTCKFPIDFSSCDAMFNVFVIRLTVKQVNNMKLQNTIMQLRKVCSHPFLFDWPLDPVIS
jgi:SNF2 family DNA or RNA helicase